MGRLRGKIFRFTKAGSQNSASVFSREKVRMKKIFDKLAGVRYYVHIKVNSNNNKIKRDNMNVKTTLPISEARKKIFKIAKEVQKPSNYYTLTEKGRPKVVLMSAEEFESWQETLEVMREFPDIEKDIKKAEKEYRKGDYITLEELLAKEGYVLSDKGKKKYGVSSDHSRKGAKRVR